MVQQVDVGAEVGLGVLAVLQHLVGTQHHGLEVAHHSVDPLRLGHPGPLDTAVTGALQAAKPLQSSRVLECLGALRFGAKVAQILRDLHARTGSGTGRQDSPSSGKLKLRSLWLTGRAC